MKTLTPRQLCDYALDGNFEAAFEVFEHAGPTGLREFLGLGEAGDEAYQQVYHVLICDYQFLLLLAKKYPVALREIIQNHSSEFFREIFQISSPDFDAAWEQILDELFQGYMKDVFHNRRRSHIGTFFVNLRTLLRGELGL